ncbi:uncharacterized protein LOC119657553 isoform X2 [Hermetia illucens]|uniref:uncharacterized protein LOC119657553 isoform X2 n=1 Tax=Hermetia illucens TaxID=343691 RepID=UPI0018CC5718|nr:uncharacterized protein LOC119657553 isoform X2 [Hermetia illucens]
MKSENTGSTLDLNNADEIHLNNALLAPIFFCGKTLLTKGNKCPQMKEKNFIWISLALSTFFWQVTVTNSRTSTLWKLNPDVGKITGFVEDETSAVLSTTPVGINEDEVFNIITSTVVAHGATWSKHSMEKSYDEFYERRKTKSFISDMPEKLAQTAVTTKKTSDYNDGPLDCGKPVNYTYYDYLIGVSQRFNHPVIPDPEAAYAFLKNKDEKSFRNFDVASLEKRLRRAKKEKPKSVHLFNQIGNYWRIKGDARQAIECFRRALAISPTNAEVLLNLARVLFNLQYLDDAIHLTRRSLEVHPPDRSAWQQYFTLGEIFKAYGHFHEALQNFQQASLLFPQHEPILKALREFEPTPTSSLHVYTIFIIVALVLAVFIVIITSNDNSDSNNFQSEFEPKMQRHFNRAMAMRSLKGFSSRSFKHHRKY